MEGIAQGTAGDVDATNVRLYVSNDDFYAGHFDDQEQWLCIKLRHPSLQQPIYGYCKKDSPVAMRIREELEAVDKETALILSLSAREEYGAAKVHIDGVLATGWHKFRADGQPPRRALAITAAH